MSFCDFPESSLQLCKSLLPLLPILFSLLSGLICFLLLGSGLLPRKLRLRLRVRLILFGEVALLSGCLSVRSRLRGLLSRCLRLLLCPHNQPAEIFRLLVEPCHLGLQATNRD